MFNLEKKIKTLLASNDLSIEKFAADIGVSARTIHNIFKSDDTKLSVLKKIADYFNVPLSYFTGEVASINMSGKQVVNGNKQIIVQKLEERNDQLLQQLIECQKKLEKCKDEMIELLRKQHLNNK